MNEIREVIMNALGLCETILALRDQLPTDLVGDLVEGAELLREQLMTAAEALDEHDES